MPLIPESYKRVYYTTARIIHRPEDTEGKHDWLWVNASSEHEFDTPHGADILADLANMNGKDNGLDVDGYPYFVVKVTRTSVVEKVKM